MYVISSSYRIQSAGRRVLQVGDDRSCLGDLFVTDPSEDKKALKRKKGDRARGTCQRVLNTDDVIAWLSTTQTKASERQATHLLWLHGDPGTGKSKLATYFTDALSEKFSSTQGNRYPSIFFL